MQDLTDLQSIEDMSAKLPPCPTRKRHEWTWAAPAIHFAQHVVRRQECPHCFRERLEIVDRKPGYRGRYRYPSEHTL